VTPLEIPLKVYQELHRRLHHNARLERLVFQADQ
jgi:hypothetical protein